MQRSILKSEMDLQGFSRANVDQKMKPCLPELVLVLLRMFTLGTPKSDGTRHITCRMLNVLRVIHIEPHLMKHQKVQQNCAWNDPLAIWWHRSASCVLHMTSSNWMWINKGWMRTRNEAAKRCSLFQVYLFKPYLTSSFRSSLLKIFNLEASTNWASLELHCAAFPTEDLFRLFSSFCQGGCRPPNNVAPSAVENSLTLLLSHALD